MAKKKKTAAAWYKRRRFQVLVVVAALAVLFIGYNLVLDWQDEKRFDQSRQSVDTLSEKIVSESTRKPDQVITVAECGRNKLKYGEGNLACSYSKEWYYSNMSLEASDEVVKEVTIYTNKYDHFQLVEGAQTNPSLKTPHNSGSQPFVAIQYTDTSTGHRCNISFQHDDSIQSTLLSVSLTCSANARNSYYSNN